VVSSAAVPERVTSDAVVEEVAAGVAMVSDGAPLSVRVTVSTSVEMLPLASLHDVVPTALPLPPVLLVHVTSVTPASSLAVPASAIVAALVVRVAADV